MDNKPEDKLELLNNMNEDAKNALNASSKESSTNDINQYFVSDVE
jgi:hypothetical protein